MGSRLNRRSSCCNYGASERSNSPIVAKTPKTYKMIAIVRTTVPAVVPSHTVQDSTPKIRHKTNPQMAPRVSFYSSLLWTATLPCWGPCWCASSSAAAMVLLVRATRSVRQDLLVRATYLCTSLCCVNVSFLVDFDKHTRNSLENLAIKNSAIYRRSDPVIDTVDSQIWQVSPSIGTKWVSCGYCGRGCKGMLYTHYCATLG